MKGDARPRQEEDAKGPGLKTSADGSEECEVGAGVLGRAMEKGSFSGPC